MVSIGPKTLTDTGSPEEFGGVYSVALGPDEEVFVADGLNHEVRVFGLDGAHRRTFGREGEGPGEFQGPDEVFRSDLRRRYVGLSSRGQTGDTLAMLRGPSSGPPGFIRCDYEDRIAFFTVPFAPRFIQHPEPGGVLYSALTSNYRVFVTRNDGAEVVMVIERPLSAESFGNDEWRAANEDYYEWRATRRGASCDPREPTRPEGKPFIEDLFVAPDGKLWVEVVRTAGNRWEVFDTEGKLLGSVPAPPRGGPRRSGVRPRLPAHDPQRQPRPRPR